MLCKAQCRRQCIQAFHHHTHLLRGLFHSHTLTQQNTASVIAAVHTGRRDDQISHSGQTGKLITASTWYFVVNLPQEEAEDLSEGQEVVVRFSRDFSGDVEMTVEQVGEPENGKAVVVLSADRDLSRITLLRRQTVEVIFESTSAIRIPKAALRLKAEEDGTQQTGVYTVVGAQAEWKPVTIVAEEEEFFLVTPAPFKNEENLTEVKKALRAGDEIIVTAENLYDGKVVR